MATPNQIIASSENVPVGESSTSRFPEVRSIRDERKEFVVGFDDIERKVLEQLLGWKKQVQIISIVGMAGLGKTTLARKLFNNPSVVYHFHVCIWTTVSQAPQKRDLLLGILNSGFNAGDENSSDMELSLILKRRLSGRRYLIVMDDIWDIGAWNDLKLCFPDDNIGSRIIFTSRLASVPLQAQPGSYQHCLPFLSENESWDLLRYKVFQQESCPSSLVEIGVHIARKCQGLPLAIVVIAGILANDRTTNWWSQVAQDMSSMAVGEYMETLLVSYNHLPNHLKSCFLYFGAFPEDYEIPAWKLILLWMGEGFIKTQNGENNLEEVAAGYLKDLTDRSLVIVAKIGSNGGIKACVIHDLLRDLCIKKADEENFLHRLGRYEHVSNFLPTVPSRSMVHRFCFQEVDEDNFLEQPGMYYFHPEVPFVSTVRRLCCISIPSSFRRTKNLFAKPLSPNVQSLLCCNKPVNSSAESIYQVFIDHRVFKFLRVMDLSGIGLSSFPIGVGMLLHLTYMAVCIKAEVIPPRRNLDISISGLLYLETFILDNRGRSFCYIPSTILSNKLRHLILKGNCSINYYTPLENLKTLCQLSTSGLSSSLSRSAPNLRKLGILNNYSNCIYASWVSTIWNFDKFEHLENLSFQHKGQEDISGVFSSPDTFPVTLKKLTLVSTSLKWDEMQNIGMLPNLEVLKIQFEAFTGERWETNDGGFRRLKHLALKFIKIVQWNTSSEHFPNLEHLKLEGCYQLEEIPVDIGDIYTLEMIEVRNCNSGVAQSAHEIKEDQVNKGNDLLRISVYQA